MITVGRKSGTFNNRGVLQNGQNTVAILFWWFVKNEYFLEEFVFLTAPEGVGC
jgi:hypothetical protein